MTPFLINQRATRRIGSAEDSSAQAVITARLDRLRDQASGGQVRRTTSGTIYKRA
jgi:hypothetical protein